MPLFDQIHGDKQLFEYIGFSNEYLGAIGFTEHGYRHAMKVGYWAAVVLAELGFSPEEVETAQIAGYLHDIANFICRTNHGQSGAVLLHQLLPQHGITGRRLAQIMSAVGNHEEQYGNIFNATCAAVVIADKSDVHRTRVRDYEQARHDIHDDVNYAVTQSCLEIDPAAKEIRLVLTIDARIASVMDYFEIFLSRMVMCRNAAQFLGCTFHITANNLLIS